MCTIMGYFKEGIDPSVLQKALEKTKTRGPDDTRFYPFKKGVLGFQRLAIMGLSQEGMQPFVFKNSAIVCNGEIYGFRNLKKELEDKGYTFQSESDCEILLPLYEEYGVSLFEKLDAEFACILYDENRDSIIAARDPIGIRPLYYGYDKDNAIVFASEPKNLMGIVKTIIPFPPGHYYEDGKFVCYADMTKVDSYIHDDLEIICQNIHDLLIQGIQKRLDADAPVGFLLSGGLDSSLVCAISQKLLSKPIRTFAIGMKEDAIDLKYAREVADVIHRYGSHHHPRGCTQRLRNGHLSSGHL